MVAAVVIRVVVSTPVVRRFLILPRLRTIPPPGPVGKQPASADGSPLSSAEMRSQLTGLRSLIDSVPVGPPGPMGPQGRPGEVTAAQLSAAISGTSNHSNGVAQLSLVVSDPPTQGEVQQIANKLDELIAALRR